MASRDPGWQGPPDGPVQARLSEEASVWELPSPERTSPAASPRRARLPWYRRAWFIVLFLVVAAGTLGAVLGSRGG